uniref:Alpha-2-macroglobulin n=1 Tax=Chelonoidis abingdonii TaxID=106734 RepID=A0A8C0GRV9_CHEAB
MGKNRLPSGPSIFLLLLFLLPGDTSPTTEPQYMVLVPFLIHTNVPEKVCIQLTHLNESVTLSATLEYAGQNRSLIADVVSEEDVFKCVPFTVPKSNSSSSAFLTVLVKGLTLEFKSRKSVLVKNSESLVFVQTDKPIYKPGQTVLFRIVSLDEDFHPLNEKDPQKNRVYQWREVELNMGLTQLSFPLPSEPIQGTYNVVVQKESGTKLEHPFTVEEYVLPKYEVLVKLPKKITIQDEELKVAVCGLYTYGTPVPGLVNVHVCRRFSQSRSRCYGREAEAVCEEFTRQADVQGCVSNVVKTKIFQLKRKGYEMKIEVQGKITEEGTGVELTGTGSSEITDTMSKISFEQVDSHYIPGIPFSGQVKLVDGTDAPIANETIRISIGRNKYDTNYTTNEEGRVWFSIDTVNFTDTSIQITANHKSELNCYDTHWVTPVYGNAAHTATRFYSLSKSFLKIEPVSHTLSCGSNEMIHVHYILKPEALGEQKEIVFYYVVMAKGGIVRAVTPSLCLPVIQKFELRLPVGPDIAPLARVLVYTTLLSGEVIANSEDFKIENCFANKVDLNFSPAEGLPASDTHLRVGASPGSVCAVRAVDKSVLLMKPETELSPSSVYDLLPVKEIRGYNYWEHHLEEEDDNPCVKLDNIILNGFIYGPISPDGLTYYVLSPLATPCTPISKKERMYGLSLDAINHVPHIIDHGPVETIRKYFPETWIWDLVTVKSVGSADLAVTIPDTITEWKANAFCNSSDTGFGMSPTVSLRAFQPFFVELTLPYSVVRGEAFTLKATVFNYLTRCIRVSISLASSDDFRATPVEKEEESYCLCVNGRKTVSWAVTPKSLGNVNFSVSAEALKIDLPCGNEVVETPDKGRKDTVIKQLLVEVGGLFSPCGKTAPQPMSLKLPENVVQGSARAYFSVLGDILGTAMQNLQQLLQMPFGCGEQNMVLFAPNIYVLDYLNKTGQLSEETKSKAIGYLVSGYQTQLKYKHQDGSYSTFGPRYGQPGNTWLTALRPRSPLRRPLSIFMRTTTDNACSPSSGTLLNNAIKHSVVRNALFCLETAAEQRGNHVYTRALLAYAFALAGKEEKRRTLLDSLYKEAVKEDGSIHWQRPGKEPKAELPFYQPRAPSAEVEMTSYVLLAYLPTQPAPSQDDLSIATQIAKWISKQQNPSGGFSSTQDTVVALQALSRYGVSTYAKSGEASTVTLQSTGNFQPRFQVDHTNRLLLQRMALPEVPGDYSIRVTGEGCVYVQTSLRYNVFPKPDEAPFALEVHTVPETCDRAKAQRTFNIAINISYTGKRPVSNMVIVDVKMLSGFIPVKSSVKMLPPESHLFSFAVEQDFPVRNLKPAVVKVYDYYETDEFAITEYSAPCSKGSV